MAPKREQLEHLLIDSNLDFMGLVQTLFNSSSSQAVVRLQGYNVFRKNGFQGKGGRVLLYVNDSLKYIQIIWHDKISIECVGVKVSLSSEM